MKIEEFSLPFDLDERKSVTLMPDGSPLAYVGYNSLRVYGREIKCSFDFRYPILAPVDAQRIAVVDAQAGRRGANYRLIDTDGRILAEARVGDFVRQVLVAGDHLVVTYFDEGVFRSDPLSNEGLSVFRLNGEWLNGYNSGLGRGASSFISDCYAACVDPSGRVLFSPYTEFPLVRLDVVTWKQEVWELPKHLWACSELVATTTHAYFWNPTYQRNDKIYAFDLESGNTSEVGSFP